MCLERDASVAFLEYCTIAGTCVRVKKKVWGEWGSRGWVPSRGKDRIMAGQNHTEPRINRSEVASGRIQWTDSHARHRSDLCQRSEDEAGFQPAGVLADLLTQGVGLRDLALGWYR